MREYQYSHIPRVAVNRSPTSGSPLVASQTAVLLHADVRPSLHGLHHGDVVDKSGVVCHLLHAQFPEDSSLNGVIELVVELAQSP